MIQIYSFIKGPSLLLSFLLFLLVSYILIGLLTTSFIKPLKYLGIGVLITGILCLGIKFIYTFAISYIEGYAESLIKIFTNGIDTIIIKNAIICLLTGFIMIIIYIILNKYLKNKVENELETKQDEIPRESIES